MTREQRNLIVWSSLLGLAWVAAACSDQANVNMAPQRPSFWQLPPPCPKAKFTGGGRIDPPGHQDATDQMIGPDATSTRGYTGQMSGKVTFGFNIFLGTDGGHCIVQKGEIQVVHHQPLYPFQVMWHVSIHDGRNDADNSVVYASTWKNGQCVNVGPDESMTARGKAVTLGMEGNEPTEMWACDNGEPGSSPGFGPDAFRWKSHMFGDTQLQYLTGGNIQAH